MSNKVSNGKYSSCCCGLGITLGFVVGGGFFGGPVLPCAVRIRRLEVEKYGIDESCPMSVCRICFCSGASLVQMLMQAEEEERGKVVCGCWTEDDKSSGHNGAVYQRMER